MSCAQCGIEWMVHTNRKAYHHRPDKGKPVVTVYSEVCNVAFLQSQVVKDVTNRHAIGKQADKRS